MDRNSHEQFRDRLVGSDRITPPLREQYEREVRMLLEKKLTAPRKWGMIAVMVMLIAQAAFFFYAVFFLKELPLLGKIGFGVGILFAASFFILLARIIRRGSINVRTDSNTYTGMIWVFMVIMITLFMLVAGRIPDPARGMSLVLNGLVFLIFGVVFLLQNTINQAQLNTREKLLEVEMRLAELREAIEKK